MKYSQTLINAVIEADDVLKNIRELNTGQLLTVEKFCSRLDRHLLERRFVEALFVIHRLSSSMEAADIRNEFI